MEIDLNKQLAEKDIIIEQLRAKIDSLSEHAIDVGNAARVATADLLFDDRLSLVHANEYFYTMLGCGEELLETAFRGDYFSVISFAPEDGNVRERMLTDLITTGKSEMNVHMRNAEGKMSWVHVNATLTNKELNDRQIILLTVSDVTDNELLRKERDGYKSVINTLFSSIHSGICEFTLDWFQIIYASSSIYSMVEADEGGVNVKFGKSLLPFVHNDDRQNVLQTIRRMKKTGQPQVFECRYYTMKGALRWVKGYLSVVDKGNGEKTGFAELDDVTEVHEISNELEQRKKNMPAMVLKLEVSAGIKVTYCNERCEEFFGMNIMDEQDILRFVYPDDREAIHGYAQAVKRGENIPAVIRTINCSDEERWLHVSASYVGLDGGFPEYYCVLLDVTDQMRMSLELQQEKQKYKVALQGTSDTIFDYDAIKDTLVYYGNPIKPSVSRLNRHTVNRFLSDRLSSEIFYEEDIPLIKSFLRGSAGGRIELRMSIAGDRKRWLWYQAEGDILWDHDRPTRIIGKMHAINDQDHTVYERIGKCLEDNKDRKYALIRMDIDNFKLVNDVCGWLEGDRLLNYCSNQLHERLMNTGCIYGRVTGDVFCILMPYTRLEELTEFSDKMASTVREYPLDLKIFMHFGIYLIDDKDIPVSVMHDWAGLALKTVKGNLLATYAFFDEAMRAKELENKSIESQMTVALTDEQFTVYLQPKYDIPTATVVGAEALIRWYHPERGMLNPDDFIPLFEKNRFIVKVDEYVWERVCMMMHDWVQKGYKLVPVSVNVSRLHIYDAAFVSKLTALLDKYEIPRELFILEFTESVFLEDVGVLYKLMSELTAAGYLISSDDFGAGYSSLNMLKSAPLHEVKLDREFLNETSGSEKGKTVMRGIISMLCSLEVSIIAEGVESKEQAEFLVSAGCNTAQGYYYSRPVDRKTFERIAFNAS